MALRDGSSYHIVLEHTPSRQLLQLVADGSAVLMLRGKQAAAAGAVRQEIVPVNMGSHALELHVRFGASDADACAYDLCIPPRAGSPSPKEPVTVRLVDSDTDGGGGSGGGGGGGDGGAARAAARRPPACVLLRVLCAVVLLALVALAFALRGASVSAGGRLGSGAAEGARTYGAAGAGAARPAAPAEGAAGVGAPAEERRERRGLEHAAREPARAGAAAQPSSGGGGGGAAPRGAQPATPGAAGAAAAAGAGCEQGEPPNPAAPVVSRWEPGVTLPPSHRLRPSWLVPDAQLPADGGVRRAAELDAAAWWASHPLPSAAHAARAPTEAEVGAALDALALGSGCTADLGAFRRAHARGALFKAPASANRTALEGAAPFLIELVDSSALEDGGGAVHSKLARLSERGGVVRQCRVHTLAQLMRWREGPGLRALTAALGALARSDELEAAVAAERAASVVGNVTRVPGQLSALGIGDAFWSLGALIVLARRSVRGARAVRARGARARALLTRRPAPAPPPPRAPRARARPAARPVGGGAARSR